MSLTRLARCRPLCLPLVFLLALSACGGQSATPPVPGAAPAEPVATSMPDSASGIDAVAEPLDDALFAQIPSEVSGRVTVPPPTQPVVEPVSTAPASLPQPPTAGVPGIGVPLVSGWSAFDLHLMTILDDGSDAVSATVLRDGEVVHEVALGTRSSAGDPVAVGDRYRIASISKVVTAVTALGLVERGAIGLDDPIGARLASRVGVENPSAGVEQISLRMLLTHRSGIAQYENLMFRREVESCPQAAASGLSRGLERAPATTFRYSNLNFCLVGLLIEDLTGEAYDDVVRRELLDPLEIDGMRLAGTFDVADGDVEHRSDEGRNYMEVLDGAGSWIAAPTDVARIVDALDPATPGWSPLSPSMLAVMRTITVDPPAAPDPDAAETGAAVAETTTTVAPPPPTRGYGMGLMVFGPESFGHTGTLESTSAMTVRQPDGITWAITVSGDAPGSGRRLAPIVAEALRYAGHD